MNKYLQKISAELKPHQERALKKLDRSGGIVLDHGTGTGKTITFLTAIERAQKKNPKGRSIIIAPASLTTNVDKEVAKHGLKIDMSKVDVLSYEKAAKDADKLRKNKYILAIGDEAQKLRNPGTQRHEELSGIIAKADKRILATATPIYNHVSDMAPLLNIAAGGHKVLPEGKAAFEQQYVSKHKESPPFLKRIFGAPPREVSVLKNKKDLKARLDTFVDSYDLESDKKEQKYFPSKSEKVIEVPMSPEQHMLYKHLEGKLPWHLRLKVRMNTDLNPKEAAQLQAFSTGVRQISNDTSKYFPKYDKPTAKIQVAVNSIEKDLTSDANFRGIVYSNFKQSGVDAYAKELDKRGISYGIYDGTLTKKQKDQVRDDYNSGKIKVMLVTSSGSEGVDTKGTKKVQILEPHWNSSKIDQVKGRAIRYKSHEHLPKNERHVEIEHYLSVFPNTIFGKSKTNSIDQYMDKHSRHKKELSSQMKELTR